MQFSASFLTVLTAALMAATPALAAPSAAVQDRADTSIRVTLSDNANEFARQLDFSASQGKKDQTISTGGKFVQVELNIGSGVANKALRCQAIGSSGQVLKFNRGANLNKATFGDGGKGPWTIVGGKATTISKVTCSPKFT